MYCLASQLSQSGENIIVFADDTRQPSQQDFDQAQGFDIRRYSGIKPLRRRKKAADIRDYIISQNQDNSVVLLTDTWKSIEFVETATFKKAVCLAHGTEISRHPSLAKQSRFKKAYSKASIIVANSRYTAGLISPYIGDQKNIKVVHPGISIPEIDLQLQKTTKQELENHHPVLITVARLEPRKNHQSIIKALPVLIKTHPEVLYIIIGDGSEQSSLQALSKRLKVTRHVRFIGRVDGTKKYAYLANSDLFVMPGIVDGDDVEGFGIAYIEAGFLGLPCIASDAGGAPEAVLHNKTGIVCNTGDQEQLEKCLLDLLCNPELRRTLGDHAQRRSKDFIWQYKIQEYLQQLNL